MKFGKKFTVVILALLALFCVASFTACGEDSGVSPVTKIVVSTMPKIDYYVGDVFDIGDAQITVYREDGTKKIIPLTAEMISDMDSDKLGEQVLTVTYDSAYAYITVDVTTAPVYSLKVSSSSHKTEYVVGDAFDATGLTVFVTYSNGYTSTVNVDASMVTGFDSASTGEKQLVISYGGRICNMTVDIVKKSVSRMQLIAPKKLAYIVGDAVDFTDGQIFVSYNNNTSEYLDLKQLYADGKVRVVLSGKDTAIFTKSSSVCEVTLYYSAQTFSYAVNVSDVKATSAAVTKDVGDQIFESDDYDFSAGEITVTYNNGEVRVLSFYSDKITINLNNFDIDKLGTFTLGINADGLTFNYDVTVVAAKPSVLEIIPTASEIYQNDPIDVTAWQYRVKLDNGKYTLIQGTGSYRANVTENMFVGNISDIDNFTIGRKKFDFKYTTADKTELKTSVEINVLAKEIVSAELVSSEKTVFYAGDAPDLTGAKLRVVYNNGETGDWKTVTTDMIVDGDGNALGDISLLTASVSDKVAVRVLYSDEIYDTSYAGEFYIKVIKKAAKISLMTAPRSTYVLGDGFDDSDWQVLITYTDGSTSTADDFSDSEWRFYNNDFDTVGVYGVALYYGESVKLVYQCTVTNDITEIYLDKAYLGFVTEGLSPDYSALNLIVTRQNGSTETVAVSQSMTDYSANSVFAPSDNSYRAAYADASNLAAADFESGKWAAAKTGYFVCDSVSGEYVSAGEYDAGIVYYVSIAALYADDWDKNARNFYVKNGTSYEKAGEYDASATYYVSVGNTKTVTVTYGGHTAVADITVAAKLVSSVSVSAYKSKYIKANTDWDASALSISVAFDNGTFAKIGGEKLAVTPQSGVYSFTVNSLSYTLALTSENVSGKYVPYGFSEFENKLETVLADGTDRYAAASLKARVTDAVNGNDTFSEVFEVYCFENLVKAIYLAAGEYDGSFTPYAEQTVYVNQNKTVLDGNGDSDAFVLDGSDKKNFADAEYIYVIYEDGTENYYPMSEAKTSASFGITGLDSAVPDSQTVTLSYLLAECTFTVLVRADTIKKITVTPVSGALTVIEGTAIAASDLSIKVYFSDADGADVDEPLEVAFGDVTCDYDKTASVAFSQKDDAGYFYARTLTVSYGGIDAAPIALTVRKKSLSRISIKTVPQQVYIEDASGATSLTYLNENGEKGSVMLGYDNGDTETVFLDDARLKINTSAFNADVELINGNEQSQTIKISYTDDNNVTMSTSYNVVIKDRKYITATYSGLSDTGEITFGYGTGESGGPDFSVYYYASFTGSAVAMDKGDGTNGTYKITYTNKATGAAASAWPTQVGSYLVTVEYAGDKNNNPFTDSTVTLTIAAKEIAVAVSDKEVTFGDVYTGSDNSALGFSWVLKGVKNRVLTDNPYCYGDDASTVVSDIVFTILNSSSNEVIFASLKVGELTKFVVNAAVGDYTVIPTLTLKSKNYYISTTVTDVESVLTVKRRPIIVVASDTEKIYGANNPVFPFEVYDFVKTQDCLRANGTLDLDGSLADYDLNAIDFPALKNAASNKLVPCGGVSKIYYYFDEDYTSMYNGGQFSETDVIYADRAVSAYKLSREKTDSENVGYHLIYCGDQTVLSDYEVYYVGASLDITKAELTISGGDASRYYGTASCSVSFSLSDGTSMKNGDTFADLLDPYFDASSVIYYNLTESKAYKTIGAEFYDNWAVLYKNVRFYYDADCLNQAFGYLQNVTLTVAGEEVTGNFGVLPVNASAGTYYVKIMLDNLSLGNYNVNTHEENGKPYSFTVTVGKVCVKINTESYIVAENSAATDINGKKLDSYFAQGGLNVISVDRNDLSDADYIDSMFRDGIISVEYTDGNGNAINYKLGAAYLDGAYRFGKTAGTKTGIYDVNITETSGNYNISLISRNVGENEDYVDYFRSVWANIYPIDESETGSDYSSDAYLLVLPVYDYIDCGNGVKDAMSEIYSHRAYADWTISTYYSLDGADYAAYTDSAVSYSILNSDITKQGISYMTAGSYTLTLTYSYFDSADRNYLYLGDTVRISDISVAKLLNYLFFGTEDALNFTETKTYTVTPVELSVKVNTEQAQYDGSGISFTADVYQGVICAGDTLNLTFDGNIVYNADTKTEEISDGVMAEFSYTNTAGGAGLNVPVTSSSDSAVKVVNAGIYTLRVAELGNANYSLGSAVTGVITVKSIDIPIYLTSNVTGSDGLTVTRTYTAASVQPIDSEWAAASDASADYSYGTTTCRIVKEYYVSSAKSEKISVGLTAKPRTLSVFAADENGQYPVKVKTVNGVLSGYDIEYNINSDYVNYSVMFVYRDGSGDYIQCDDAHKYTLVIQPRDVYLYNFYRVNSKNYDGNEVLSDSINRTALTVVNDFTADPISKAKIVFTFSRLDGEASTYITDMNGVKYRLVSSNDLKSAGTLLAHAYYSDNYNFVFKDSSAYSEDPTYGLYYINRLSVVLTLNNTTSAALTKQYDGYGLTKFDNTAISGDFNDLSPMMKGSSVADNYENIYYMLDLKYYNTLYSSAGITAATAGANAYSYIKGGASYSYGTGFYWYKLRGVFDSNGNYIAFNTVNSSYASWLNWNYTYGISFTGAVLNGCDGVFEIGKRQIYMIVNAAEDENGIVTSAANIPSTDTAEYVYYHTYDGTTYSSATLKTDLNSTGGLFGYGFYVSVYNSAKEKSEFCNITKYSAYDGAEYLGDDSVLSGNFHNTAQLGVTADMSLTDANSSKIPLLFTDILAANTNFTVMNSQSSIAIKALTLKVKLEFVNVSTSVSSMIYGTTFDTGYAIKLVFTPQEIYSGSDDVNLQSAANILNNIIYVSGGSVIIYSAGGTANKFALSACQAKDGYRYIGNSALASFAAGDYITGGEYLSSNSARYLIDIVSADFIIEKQAITVNGALREYFDKNSADYTLTTAEGTNTAISAVLTELKKYLTDNTNIDASVGSYEAGSESTGGYYITVPCESFVSSNGNYVVKASDIALPEGADKTNYVYIPLSVCKADISISLSVADNVEYGDTVTSNKCVLSYDGFAVLSGSKQYTYTVNATQRVDTYTDEASALQTALKNYIVQNVLDVSKVITRIASSSVGSYWTESVSGYVSDKNPEFDNFTVKWGVLKYTVIKKNITVTIKANQSYHYTIDDNQQKVVSGYFSARWSEKDSLFYNVSSADKLSYQIGVSDFSINGIGYTTLESKITEMLGLTVNESGKYVYGNKTYDTIDDFLANELDYKIDTASDSDAEATAAGLRYIGITGLSSSNFSFKYEKEPIMLYPEIDYIGDNALPSGDAAENVVSDAEAALTGVSVNKDTKLISGLSMYIQLNYTGLESGQNIQYLDTADNYYNSSYYDGNDYTRTLKMIYVSGASTDTAQGISFAAGDVVTARFVLTETFYSGSAEEYINELDSQEFCVTFKQSGSSSTGYITVYADKTSGELKNNSDNSDGLFDTALSDTSSRYYFADGTTKTVYDTKYDAVTVRSRLTPVSGANAYSYTIGLYENAYGTLTLDFVSGSSPYYRARMTYASNCYPATDTTARQGVTYYNFSNASVTGGAAVPADTYYVLSGSGYTLTSDTEFVSGTDYYTRSAISVSAGSAVPADSYVDFTESVISEQLVELFDSASHTVNVYIDTVGVLANMAESRYTVNFDYGYYKGNETVHKFTADRLYYLYVTVDSRQYIFSYIGGSYSSVGTYSDTTRIEYCETRDTTAQDGTVYYRFTEVSLTDQSYQKNTYYIYSDNAYIITNSDYNSGIQYYSASAVESPTDMSGLYVEVKTVENGTVYALGGARCFDESGKTYVKPDNLNVIVSKYSIKNRLIASAVNKYIANVTFWPAQPDSGEYMFVTNASTAQTYAEGVMETLSKVGYLPIGGGSVNSGAYSSVVSSVNNSQRIEYSYTIMDYRNQKVNSVSDIEGSGLYTITYSAKYNYGTENSYDISTDVLKLYVTDDVTKAFTLKEYTNAGALVGTAAYSVTSSSPQTFASSDSTYKYYFTSDLSSDITSLTYVVDNVVLDTDKTDSLTENHIWIYFKVSDVRLIDMTYPVSGLNSDVGLALRISKSGEVVTTVLYATICSSQTDGDVQHLYWLASTTDIDWTGGVNIIKLEFMKDESDSVAALRIYRQQSGGLETDLMWQQYLRKNSLKDTQGTGISAQDIYDIINVTDKMSGWHCGLSVQNSSVRLLDFHYGFNINNDADFVKYDYSAGNLADAGKGAYVSGDSPLLGAQNYYAAADGYGVPYAFTGNALTFRFEIGETTSDEGFNLFFGCASPFYVNTTADSDTIRQRGMYLQYYKNKLYLGVYQYISHARMSLLGEEDTIDFYDGEEHTITIVMDTDNVQTSAADIESDEMRSFAEACGSFCYVYVLIDGNSNPYIGALPYYNDLSQVTFSQGGKVDEYNGDEYFFKGVYYTAFNVRDDVTPIRVYDMIAYRQIYQ